MRKFEAGDLVLISENLNPEEYSDDSRGYEETPGWDEYMWYLRGKLGKIESGVFEWGGIRVTVKVEDEDDDAYEVSYIFFHKDLTLYNPISKWRRREIT
jgi:hypothetical protein